MYVAFCGVVKNSYNKCNVVQVMRIGSWDILYWRCRLEVPDRPVRYFIMEFDANNIFGANDLYEIFSK